jgi:hypothetical protein
VLLTDLTSQVSGFESLSLTEKILSFAWYLQTHAGKASFTVANIRDCFTTLALAPPANPQNLINNLVAQKRVLKRGNGYTLEATERRRWDDRITQRPAQIAAHRALLDLPAKISNAADRGYLQEAIRCYRAEAFRAAIVMSWSVAYDHVCETIVAKHLADFQAKWLAHFVNSKKKPTFTKREDFYEHGEKDVLYIAHAIKMTDKNVNGILEDSLRTRNLAAHASGVTFEAPQAEAYILNLINNAMLKL